MLLSCVNGITSQHYLCTFTLVSRLLFRHWYLDLIISYFADMILWIMFLCRPC